MNNDIPHVFSFPNNEWGFLLKLLKQLALDLNQTASEHPGGLFCKELDELCDLLIVAQAFVDLAESRDMRIHLRNWHDYARSRMIEIKSDQ